MNGFNDITSIRERVMMLFIFYFDAWEDYFTTTLASPLISLDELANNKL
ncbi:hypothetical protein FHX64_002971 [Microbacter margulisiae]|uniref:Uncharacterized protein n=1 Tax=Microbacter margulisiae TaxID=1350067 RepID=A0A7W5DV50_9PORP|nr:hypothetical protein [Microbacter margulisiae]